MSSAHRRGAQAASCCCTVERGAKYRPPMTCMSLRRMGAFPRNMVRTLVRSGLLTLLSCRPASAMRVPCTNTTSDSTCMHAAHQPFPRAYRFQDRISDQQLLVRALVYAKHECIV